MEGFTLNEPPKPTRHFMSAAARLRQMQRLVANTLFGLIVLIALLVTVNAALAHGTDYDHRHDGVDIIEVGLIKAGPPPATFGGCYISTGKGLLQDIDCDRVPDYVDNCPVIPNPDQFDQTSNGLGDACDLIIEMIEPEPRVVLQGRAQVTTVTLTNYREYDMRNLDVTLEVPALGIADQETHAILDTMTSADLDLYVRAPDCALPGEYEMIITIEYPYTAGKKEIFAQSVPIAVQYSGNCPIEPTASDKTIIDIIEIQDVDPMTGAVYPFTIMNNEATDKAYVLTTDGLAPWGEAQIEPGTIVIVPAGESREGVVRVWAYPGVMGEHSFSLTFQAKDDIEQVVLLADIAEEPATPPTTILIIVFGIIVAVAIIVTLLLVVKRTEKK